MSKKIDKLLHKKRKIENTKEYKELSEFNNKSRDFLYGSGLNYLGTLLEKEKLDRDYRKIRKTHGVVFSSKEEYKNYVKLYSEFNFIKMGKKYITPTELGKDLFEYATSLAESN